MFDDDRFVSEISGRYRPVNRRSGSGSYRLFTVRVVPRGFGNRLGTDSEEVFRTKRNYYQSGGERFRPVGPVQTVGGYDEGV